MRILIAGLMALLGNQATAETIDQDRWTERRETVKLANGQKIAVYEYGDPAGKPLVLLHGLTDSSRSWTLLLPAFSEFRVIIPDQRGHGASSRPECRYSLADYAFDLKLVMDELEIERAAIAGHSLGSMVAMEFAAVHAVRRLLMSRSTISATISSGSGRIWSLRRWSNSCAANAPADLPAAV